MASDEDVDELRENLRRTVALAKRELALFWGSLDHTRPANEIIDAVQSFMADLIPIYGDIAATLAADWFEKVVPGVTAIYPEEASAGQIETSARWAAANVVTGKRDPVKALSGVTDRLVKQAARSTIARGVARNPGTRYARVPRGDTCAFCLVLASRGAVYHSHSSAGGLGRYANKWHDDCDCVAVPIRENGTLPAGYDIDRLYDKYKEGRRIAGSGDFKDILSGVRVANGGSH